MLISNVKKIKSFDPLNKRYRYFMTNFQAFFAMSEHVCHFGTHENDSFALSGHFPFRNIFFCHVGTFFHFGTQLFAMSEHGMSRNGNHLDSGQHQHIDTTIDFD